MPKTVHCRVLLFLLGLIALSQLGTLAVSLYLTSTFVGLNNPDQWMMARLDGSQVLPFRHFSMNLVHLCEQILICSAVVLLASAAAIWVLRRCVTEPVDELSDGEASDQAADAPARPAPSAANAHAVVPVAAKGEAERLASLFHHLVHKAHHDTLTGLPNRSLVMDRLKQALAHAERHNHTFAVLFIDLNGFKALNDNHGHRLGDRVLRKTGERLVRSVRSLDTVARLGGDEFLIILDQVDAEQAMATAQTLTTIVRQPVRAATGPVSVGMSIGIAIFPTHGREAGQLVHAADEAMYRSKQSLGQPAFATPVATAAAAPNGRSFDSTAPARLLETWAGTVRGLRTLRASPLDQPRQD